MSNPQNNLAPPENNFNKNMRILLIEDNKEIINFLQKSLKAECYIVDVAEDGEKGSFLARTNEYDLVILDYILPQKDGLAVCKEIRKDGKTVPIIILTVKSEVEDKITLLNSGADDYLTKPFSFAELLARIKALLRRPKKVEKEVLKIDDLVVNTNGHTTKRGAKEIYLTRKEFTLLEYLIRNQGKVLSRGMLMEHVWDMEADPFSNTIESHILNLRRKIDFNGKKKLIHTVPGRGYKLDIRK